MATDTLSCPQSGATPEKNIIGLLILRRNLVARHNRLVYQKAKPEVLQRSIFRIGIVTRKLFLMGE